MTKQRKLIYQIVKDSMSHLSAEEIFFRAKQVMPSISMGTVYRNLGLMVEDKELRKIPFKGKSDLFDATMYDHEHAVCVECGKVVDIFIDDLKEQWFIGTDLVVPRGVDINASAADYVPTALGDNSQILANIQAIMVMAHNKLNGLDIKNAGINDTLGKIDAHLVKHIALINMAIINKKRDE